MAWGHEAWRRACAVVEPVDRQREDRRVAAHFGERSEARVAVERRVLDALGHHRAGRLLEPARHVARRIREHRDQACRSSRRGRGDERMPRPPPRRAVRDRRAGRSGRPGSRRAARRGRRRSASVGRRRAARSLRIAQPADEPRDLGALDRVGDHALRVVDEVGVVRPRRSSRSCASSAARPTAPSGSISTRSISASAS